MGTNQGGIKLLKYLPSSSRDWW